MLPDPSKSIVHRHEKIRNASSPCQLRGRFTVYDIGFSRMISWERSKEYGHTKRASNQSRGPTTAHPRNKTTGGATLRSRARVGKNLLAPKWYVNKCKKQKGGITKDWNQSHHLDPMKFSLGSFEVAGEVHIIRWLDFFLGNYNRQRGSKENFHQKRREMSSWI